MSNRISIYDAKARFAERKLKLAAKNTGLSPARVAEFANLLRLALGDRFDLANVRALGKNYGRMLKCPELWSADGVRGWLVARCEDSRGAVLYGTIFSLEADDGGEPCCYVTDDALAFEIAERALGGDGNFFDSSRPRRITPIILRPFFAMPQHLTMQ